MKKQAANKSEAVRITVRKVPDVAAAAQYAGLPAGVRPFKERERNGERYYEEFSNSTHTVLRLGAVGIGAILAPAIDFRNKFDAAAEEVHRTADEVHRRFPRLEAVLKLSVEDVERRIVPGADAEAIAEEIVRDYVAQRPELQAYSPFESSRKRGRPKSKYVESRRGLIRKAASRGLEGEDYCNEAQKLGLKTHVEWKLKGCPPELPDAWNYSDPTKQKEFKKLISSEKSRHTHSLAK